MPSVIVLSLRAMLKCLDSSHHLVVFFLDMTKVWSPA